METQRIMVTGGSGFIGTNLVNEVITVKWREYLMIMKSSIMFIT